MPILGCTLKTWEQRFNRIYGLQENCKNIVMRFQSPLVYVVDTHQNRGHETVPLSTK